MFAPHFALRLAKGYLVAALLSFTSSLPAMAQEIEVTQVTRPGFASVNSWLIEGDDGVVVIDVQRVLSSGRDVVAAIEATGKPLLAVIITHPHPDHFGGLTVVQAAFPDAPVHSSAETAEMIRTDSNGYQAATRKAVPDDSPETYPSPDRVFSDGETLRLGDLEFVIDEIGAGESETMTMLYLPAEDALFVGDLVANGMTGFLLEGRSADWIAQIDDVVEEYGSRSPRVYPGHGAPGEFSDLLTDQRQWLVDLRTLVAQELDGDGLTDAEVAGIEAEFSSLYQDYPNVAEIPPLMELNIRAVERELLQQN